MARRRGRNPGRRDGWRARRAAAPSRSPQDLPRNIADSTDASNPRPHGGARATSRPASAGVRRAVAPSRSRVEPRLTEQRHRALAARWMRRMKAPRRGSTVSDRRCRARDTTRLRACRRATIGSAAEGADASRTAGRSVPSRRHHRPEHLVDSGRQPAKAAGHAGHSAAHRAVRACAASRRRQRNAAVLRPAHGVQAPRAGAGGGEVQEDEAEQDRRVAAVQHREEAARGAWPMK